MDKIGGLMYTNGRADDTMPGAARSGPHARANVQEVGMNVARPPFRGDTSPESSPDCKGADRGAGAVSVYPERDLNPHAAQQQGILSHFSIDSASVQIAPDREWTAPALSGDPFGLIPNEARTSPEVSPDIMARVRARVAFSPSGCWIWQGAKNSRGYAQMGMRVRGGTKNVSKSVHRLMAEWAHGPIPEGGLACHTCDVRDCVNPAHLYIGTAGSNMRDMIVRGRAKNVTAARNASKTHCPKGHEYNARNTYIAPDGHRQCRVCKRVAQRITDRTTRHTEAA